MIIEICRNVLWKLIKSVDFLLKYSYNLINKSYVNPYENNIYIKEEFIMYGEWMKDMPIVVGSENKDKKIK
mgnify:FL=1